MNEIITKEQAERRKVKWSIFSIVLMIALIIVNEWIFRSWLKMDYIRWYIDNGVFISLGFSFLSLSYELDEFTDIISTDPLRYLGIYLNLIGGVIFAWGGPLKRDLFCWDEIPGNDNGKLIEFLKQNFDIDWVKTAKIEKIDDGRTIKISNGTNFLSLGLNNEKTRMKLKIDDGRNEEFKAKILYGKLKIYLMKPEPQKDELSTFMSGKIISFFQFLGYIFDIVIAVVFSLMLVLVIIAWLLVVAPVQYFVYLVAGAYPRVMLQSKRKVLYRISDNGNFEPLDIHKDETAPEGATEVGFFRKPVTLTSSVAAVLLWALSQVI